MLGISAIIGALNWWLIGSCRTGEFIVSTAISFYHILINAVKSFNAVFILLCEGSTLWFQDIYEYICAVEEFIHNSYDYSSDIFSHLVSIASKVIYTPFEIIAEILISLREFLLLLGNSCLFLISLPPLFLFYSVDSLLHLFKTFTSFARYATKRFAEHAADIKTLEALLGLVVGCGLILIAISGIKFLTRSYSRYKNQAVRALRTTWRTAKTRMTMAKRRKRDVNEDCKLQETELCVVCFEEARSVCFLPCRHLCLCVTCTESLSYPLKCPLCRQRAEDLIHVYL